MALQGRLCLTAATWAACSIIAPTSASAVQSTDASTGTAPTARGIAEEELEPIIVTARRREEETQQIPLSVLSLRGDELEARSLKNLRGLQYFVPNLTFAPSQNVGDAAGNIFIRGIGQEDFVAGAEPGVGFYLDGVYVARTMGTLINLVDIDRIEVLRGPQGTLYGKNAIGGAINIISAAPDSELRGYADLIAGNIDRFELRGVVNAPLTKTLFVRLAGGRITRRGYLRRLPMPFSPTPITETNHDREGSEDSLTGRLQLRWLAGPSLTIDVAADASRRRGTQGATHVDAIDPRFGILTSVNTLIREGKLPGPEITDTLATDNLLTSYAGGPNSIAQKIRGLSAAVSKEMGEHSIKLIAAQRRLHSHVATDLDGTWFSILQTEFAERHRQNSAELQASGTLGKLTYTAGLFALGERIQATSGRGVSRVDVLYLCDCFYPTGARPLAAFTRRRQSGANFAAYAQASYLLTGRLTATAGGRLSRERKSTEVQLVQLDPDTLKPTELVVRSGTNSGQWNSFTWRTGLEFQAAPDLMLYASAAKGYKSGGFNTRPVANLPNLGLTDFAPETALAYEGGIRSQWFSRRLRLNATLFHTDYRDIQLRQQTFVDGVLTTVIRNAARARVRGVEIEAAAQLSRRFTASFAYGHLDARYLEVARVPGVTLNSSFQRTPRNSFTTSLEYSLPIGNREITVHGDYSYRSHEQFQLVASPFDQGGYSLLGARFTLRDPRERWSVALFGTNLMDERYRTAGRGYGITEVGFANSVIGLPRQVGVEFRAEF